MTPNLHFIAFCPNLNFFQRLNRIPRTQPWCKSGAQKGHEPKININTGKIKSSKIRKLGFFVIVMASPTGFLSASG